MGISRVDYGGRTLIYFTNDTVKSEVLRVGYTAHGADGEAITGTLKTAALEPYIFDLNRGWVGPGNGVWTPERPTQTYADVYEVTGGHRYFLTFGVEVGTRARTMFTTEDVSATTQKVTGVGVNPTGYDNPAPYSSFQYTPETDGYIVIAKDNVGKSGIKTYLYDMTEAWE